MIEPIAQLWINCLLIILAAFVLSRIVRYVRTPQARPHPIEYLRVLSPEIWRDLKDIRTDMCRHYGARISYRDVCAALAELGDHGMVTCREVADEERYLRIENCWIPLWHSAFLLDPRADPAEDLEPPIEKEPAAPVLEYA